MKIAVTDDRYGNYDMENSIFRARLSTEAVIYDLKNESDAIAALADSEAILCNLFPLTGNVISRLKKCRVISRYGSGYDNVDTDAAGRAGIAVTYVPNYATEEVADHTIALLYSLIRAVVYRDRMIRKKSWNIKCSWRQRRLEGLTLGLVGYGHIGQAVHRKAAGVGIKKIAYFSPSMREAKVFHQIQADRKDSIDELLAVSDIVSLHLPLNNDSRNLLNMAVLEKTRAGTLLINTSRGGIVDEKALAHFLTTGQIAAAAIDVFNQEPIPVDSPLLSLDNVVLTDHAAWYSVESQNQLKKAAAENVVSVLETGAAPFMVG